MTNIKGFSDTKVDKIQEALRKCSPDGATGSFITASELMVKRKRVIKISTGSKNLDASLGGQVFESRSLIHNR